jgi:energy-converting hydrogenase Eha subunit G
MRMTLSEVSLLAFSVFSGLRLVSYIPQICRVARDENGASAISYATWALWTGNNISTGLYAAINLSDLLLAGASILYALCCLIVITITASKRQRTLRRATLKTPAVASR